MSPGETWGSPRWMIPEGGSRGPFFSCRSSGVSRDRRTLDTPSPWRWPPGHLWKCGVEAGTNAATDQYWGRGLVVPNNYPYCAHLEMAKAV